MEIKDYNLEDLELAYAKIKIDLGKKIAEQRENAGFPKVSYHGGKKSATYYSIPRVVQTCQIEIH